MPLTLITGSANSGKSEKLYARLVDAAKAGSRATLVLPGREDVERARAAVAQRCGLGVGIVTFPQLIEGLWDSHGDGRAVVRPEQRAALLGRLLDDGVAEALPNGPGLRAIICQLAARAAVDPHAVASGDATAERLAVVVRALRARMAEAGLIERPEAALRLVQRGISLGGVVAVNRFTDLEEWQVELIFGLAQSDDVVVALTHDSAVPATAVSGALVDRIASKADRRSSCEERLPAEERTTIQMLAHRLFSVEEALEFDGAVSFAEASSAEGEAALAARAARQAIEDGFRAERVAVAYRDVAKRRHHVQAAFLAEGIDVEIAYETALSATGLGRAIAALVTAAAGRGSARDISTFAGSPYAGDLRVIATTLDRRLRRGGITDGASALRLLAGGPAHQAGVADSASALVKAARRCSRGLSTPEDARAWNKLAAHLVGAAGAARGTGAAGPDNIADLRALSMIGTLVAQVLETQAALGPLDVLASFEQAKVGFGGSDAPGTVKVLDVGALRSRRFDVVLIGGLTAHDFAPTRSEPLIGALSRRLGLPSGSESAAVDRQLFYLAVSRARHRLVLTRQSANDRGEPIRPSAFWDEARARFGITMDEDGAEHTGVTRLGVEDVVLNSPAVSADRRTLRALALTGCAPRRPCRGELSEESIADIVSRKRVFSPTELETWLTCPYRWFYDRLLRPDTMDVELDALALGSLAHDLLHEFYAQWTSEGPRRVSPEDAAEALALFDVIAPDLTAKMQSGESGSLASDVAVSRTVAKARRAIEADAELAAPYVPTAFEVPFGDEEPFLFGGVPVHGRIDRVDVGPAGVLVIDYKSGGTQKNWGSWSGNAVLQLPIYAEYVSRTWGKPIAGAAYRSLTDGDLKGFSTEKPPPVGFNRNAPITDGELDELMATARENAARAAAGILSGDIARRPLSADACGYCGLAQVCER